MTTPREHLLSLGTATGAVAAAAALLLASTDGAAQSVEPTAAMPASGAARAALTARAANTDRGTSDVGRSSRADRCALEKSAQVSTPEPG